MIHWRLLRETTSWPTAGAILASTLFGRSAREALTLGVLLGLASYWGITVEAADTDEGVPRRRMEDGPLRSVLSGLALGITAGAVVSAALDGPSTQAVLFGVGPGVVAAAVLLIRGGKGPR